MMEPEEADEWSRGTAFPGPWYHGTDLNEAGMRLLTHGFDPAGGHGLKVYGPGLYLTQSLTQALRYGSMPVECRVKVSESRVKTLPPRPIGERPDLPKPGTYDVLFIPPTWLAVAKTECVTVVHVHAAVRAEMHSHAFTIEAPDEKTVKLYHGTTANAWVKIRQGGFAGQDIRKLCRDIEDEFGIQRGKIWRNRMNQWGQQRAKDKALQHFYATADRKVAEGYAQAGSAPLYDFLSIAYILKHPRKKREDFFGTHYEGMDNWLVQEVRKRGGGPVLITLEVPESVVRESNEARLIPAMRTAPWSKLKRALTETDALRLDGIAWTDDVNLTRFIQKVEPLTPVTYIRTQNKLQASLGLPEGTILGEGTLVGASCLVKNS